MTTDINIEDFSSIEGKALFSLDFGSKKNFSSSNLIILAYVSEVKKMKSNIYRKTHYLNVLGKT